MTEKKDPHQKFIEDDFSDDDPIIDLTDEVIIKPGEGGKAATRKSDDILSEKAAKDPTFENDDDLNLFEENGKFERQDSFFSETGDQMAEKFVSDPDDVVIMDSGQDDVDANLTAMVEGDTLELTGDENPSDLEKEIELEYDADEDDLDFLAADGHAAYGDGIAMPSEASPVFEDDDDGLDILEDIEFELNEGEEIIASSEAQNEPTEIIDMQREETPEFDRDGNLSDLTDESLPLFDDNAGMESENDVISLADFDDDDAEIEEDIIEITEFDHHYPEEEGELLEHAGILDPSGLEDEGFLELFEIEAESPTEDEVMKALSESEEKAVEAELSRLFDDTLEDEALFENNATKPAEESSAPSPDWALTASALSAGAGKTDHPGQLFAKYQHERDKRLMEDFRGSNKGESQSITSAQIDMAIERVINEKFADRIEQIIYETIEKAVSKEIARLKGDLLEGSSRDDDF
jgi:hypothetical protein